MRKQLPYEKDSLLLPISKMGGGWGMPQDTRLPGGAPGGAWREHFQGLLRKQWKGRACSLRTG